MAITITELDTYKLDQLDKIRAQKEAAVNLIAALESDLAKANAELARISAVESTVRTSFKSTIDKVEAIRLEAIAAEEALRAAEQTPEVPAGEETPTEV